MKKERIVFILVVVLIIPLFYQCQKGNIEKKNSVEEYLSDNYIDNVETLKEFYSVAIQNIREKGTLKSAGLTVFTIENQVAQMCNERFGGEFDTVYVKIKDLTGIEPFKSKGIEDDYYLSEYVKNLILEIENGIDRVFEEENASSNEELQESVAAELIFYQDQIVNDEILSVDEKTYLINSIQSQIIMLPTTFEVADLLFQTNGNSENSTIKMSTLKRGWFKKTLKKVARFTLVVVGYGLIATGVSDENPYVAIGGLVVGLGVAIYCEIEGYNKCACDPLGCVVTTIFK